MENVIKSDLYVIIDDEGFLWSKAGGDHIQDGIHIDHIYLKQRANKLMAYFDKEVIPKNNIKMRIVKLKITLDECDRESN